MVYETQEIEINSQKMPYRIDNFVLQMIQTKYSDIQEFQNELMGWEKNEEGKVVKTKDISLNAINFIFPEMVKEGYACKNKECPYTDAEIIRAIDKPYLEMAIIINGELIRSITGKKKEKKTQPRTRKPRSASTS